MAERKLATVQIIEEVRPIPRADRIEALRIGGWWVVDKKGHKAGDKVVFFEVDSFLPQTPPFEFLKARGTRTHEDGSVGYRLKTVKLRKQISQGLVMKPEALGLRPDALAPGTDLTHKLGVKVWEGKEKGMPLMGNEPLGKFPYDIPKTQQPRIQNLAIRSLQGEYEVTLKLDGTSFTAYHIPELSGTRAGVCSRNHRVLAEAPSGLAGMWLLFRFFIRWILGKVGIHIWPYLRGAGNSIYAKYYRDNSIATVLRNASQDLGGRGIAIQGELMGPGIQGNRENLEEVTLFVFSVYVVGSGYMLPFQRRRVVEKMGLRHVPVVDTNVEITELTTRDDLLAMADRKSLNHEIAEGVVFKRNDGAPVPTTHFKVINNRFLLKEKD